MQVVILSCQSWSESFIHPAYHLYSSKRQLNKMRGGLALVFVMMVVSAIISPAAMLTDPRKSCLLWM